MVSRLHTPKSRRNSRPTGTDRPREAALRRLQLVQLFEALVRKGLASSEAARECGLSRVTLWRYQRALKNQGLTGLEPGTHRSGRVSLLRKLGVQPDTLTQVQRLAVALGSNTAAWRQFALSPNCPPSLAAFLEKSQSIPSSFLEATRLKTTKATLLQGAGFAVL